MKTAPSWRLFVCGCGTVGFTCTDRLTVSPVARGLEALTLIDRAIIRPANGITCPGYVAHVGRAKSSRLEEIARERLTEDGLVRSLVQDVEGLDWPALLGQPHESPRIDVVLIGLDNWQSRLCVV